jgi:anti-anti-sigma factor
MSDLLSIQPSAVGEVTLLEFEGNLDTNSAPDAQAALTEAISDGARKLLVDFEQLDFISSAGLRVLLSAAKAIGREGGKMHICTLNETVDEVFEISGFSTIFNVFATRDDAIGGF